MKTILFLPEWYPNRHDPQLGLFVQKHAQAAALFRPIAVLYAIASNSINNKYIIEVDENKNLTEIIVYYKPYPSAIGTMQRIGNTYRYFNALNKGYKQYFSTPPQGLHLHILGKNSFFAYCLHLFYRLPYWLTEHWSGYITSDFSRRSLFMRLFSRYIARRAVGVTAVSSTLKMAMQQQLNRPDIAILPNVVESLPPSNKPTTHILEKDKIRFLSVCDLKDEVKNISGILDAIATLPPTLPPFCYHIIGGGEDENKLKQKANQLGIAALIRWHGLQTNNYVLQLINQCDFLVSNSNYETFGIVVLEALLAGKPVIATTTGVAPQIITPDCGILIPPHQSEALQQALNTMLHNYATYDTQQVAQYLREKYSLKSIGLLLENEYAKLTATSPIK